MDDAAGWTLHEGAAPCDSACIVCTVHLCTDVILRKVYMGLT
jgi:hypothetical protein